MYLPYYSKYNLKDIYQAFLKYFKTVLFRTINYWEMCVLYENIKFTTKEI